MPILVECFCKFTAGRSINLNRDRYFPSTSLFNKGSIKALSAGLYFFLISWQHGIFISGKRARYEDETIGFFFMSVLPKFLVKQQRKGFYLTPKSFLLNNLSFKTQISMKSVHELSDERYSKINK